MSPEIPQPSSDNAMEFFTDPHSYDDFSKTKDLKRIIACIDPRLPGQVSRKIYPADIEDYKVTTQTDGGGAGLALDGALLFGVKKRRAIPLSECIPKEAEARVTNVLDAHHDCKFLNGIVTVVGEMANPSDQTMDRVERWDGIYGVGLLERRTFNPLKDAAGRQEEVEQDQCEVESVLRVVDELYPHPNVRHMAGQNEARLHVVNHHPFAGIDRRRQAKRVLAGKNVQGYHNNLGAIVELSQVLRGLNAHDRQIRAGSAILRAAATMTVVTNGVEGMRFLEVFPDQEKGLRFEEIAA